MLATPVVPKHSGPHTPRDQFISFNRVKINTINWDRHRTTLPALPNCGVFLINANEAEKITRGASRFDVHHFSLLIASSDLMSPRMNCLPAFLAASPTTPLPQKKSSTVSPSSVDCVINFHMRTNGFSVG